MCYTRVLQAHIALDRAVFPPGTPGQLLDPLARAPLWRAGLDYKHGTGHGVGFFLNVHEGPQAISFRPHPNPHPLLNGMIVSNEPGYYEDGEFGIRIENVVECVEADTPGGEAFGHGGSPYLAFKPLTLVPMCSLLIDPALLDDVELKWLDAYHARVRASMAPLLTGDAATADDDVAYKWMMRETEPIAPVETLRARQAAWL